MTLVRITPDNRGNLGPPADNLPVYSRDVNQIIKVLENGNGIIAKLENINLKDKAPNILDWLGTNLANNTGPANVVAKYISGTYAQKTIPETPATTTIVFDETAFPSNMGLGYLIQIFVGPTELFNGHEDAGFASIEDYMDFIKGKYEFWGYSVVIDELNMELTGAEGLGATINGLVNIVQSRDDNANVFTDSLSSSPAFAGGISSLTTSFDLFLDSTAITDITNATIMSNIIQLNSGNVFSSPIKPIILPSTGNWRLPVTVGALNDFVISIFIYGNQI